VARKGAVEVDGLKEFQRSLRTAADPKAAKAAFKEAQLPIAEKVAAHARGYAGRIGGSAAHFAPQITGKATQRAATVGVPKVAFAAFWGAKKRTGWYAAGRYRNSTRQHRPWIGNSWDITQGQGPYAIAPAVKAKRDEIEQAYLDAMSKVSRKAFPD
jgi:hypothetical protein